MYINFINACKRRYSAYFSNDVLKNTVKISYVCFALVKETFYIWINEITFKPISKRKLKQSYF